MTTSTPLPRCLFPGCPVRWRGTGPDRLCRDHGDETGIAHLLGYDPLAPDGGESDGGGDGRRADGQH